jgi:RecA/RadA recombinase
MVAFKPAQLPSLQVLRVPERQLYHPVSPIELMELISNVILSNLSSIAGAEAVYIDTLGTFNPALLGSLLSHYSTDTSILDRIHLMTAFSMADLLDACEKIKNSISEGSPIQFIVIDTITNPLSLELNKGQLQGT